MSRSLPPLAGVTLAALAGACTPAAVAPPGAAPVTAPVATAAISDVSYELGITTPELARRRVAVTMRFRVAGDGPVRLSLPAWTPGAYEISNFARRVVDFRADDAAGRPLAWDKADADTWRVQPGAAREVVVRFAALSAEQPDNGALWTARDFALVNGTTVFLHPEGRALDDYAATVHVRTEPQWLVATGMDVVARDAEGGAAGARAFTARSYHDLVDMPFFVGRISLDSTQVSGRWFRLATYPATALEGEARRATWDQFRRMTPPLVQVFGDVPWRTYTTMVLVDPRSMGGAGLEHQNSHVDIVTPLGIGTEWLASLYAHEIAHAWNVKRLRPADLVPYRYDAPQPTPWLWVSEGVTDYYADLALVRGGITTPDDFAEATTNKIAEVDSVPAVALEDASLSTWIAPVDGTATIYYAKGSLAGLLLDVMIRDASDNRGSLDGVMRALYEGTWKRGRGFTGDDWWGAVKRAAGVDGDAARGRRFDDFRSRHVDGRERFPYDSVLPLAGLRVVADTTRAPRLGIGFTVDSAGALINEVVPGGAASLAGVRAGDVLLAVGGVALTDPDFASRFSRTFRGGDAQTVLRVRRGGQALALPVKVPLVALVAHRVELDSGASAKARRIRDAMLSGK